MSKTTRSALVGGAAILSMAFFCAVAFGQVAIPQPVADVAANVPAAGADPGLADLLSGVGDVYAGFRTGVLAGLVALVMLLTRIARTSIGGKLLERLPSNWRWSVPAALGLILAVLIGIQSGQPWYQIASDAMMLIAAAIGGHHWLSDVAGKGRAAAKAEPPAPPAEG